LLESLPHIPEVENVISIVEYSCTIEKRSISFFWQAHTPEIGGSDLVVSSWRII
jgi:hypothetical protein